MSLYLSKSIHPSNRTIIIPSVDSILSPFHTLIGSMGLIFICWTCIKCSIIRHQNLLEECTNEEEYNTYESDSAENNIDLEVAERSERRERRVSFGSNNIKTKTPQKIIEKKEVTDCDNNNNDEDDDDKDLPSYSEVYSSKGYVTPFKTLKP